MTAQSMLLCRSAHRSNKGGNEDKRRSHQLHVGFSSSSCDPFLWREAQVAIKSAASPAPLFLVLQPTAERCGAIFVYNGGGGTGT